MTSSSERGARAGLTLLELLVVIVLLSMLMGLSVFLFRSSNRDLGVRAATNSVVSLLRAAAEHARAESTPAQVVFDVQERSVFTLTQETLGMWHLEDERGAFGSTARSSKVTWVPGYYGTAAALTASSTIEAGVLPVNSPNAGIAVDCYVKRSSRVRSASRRPQVVCSIGDQLELAIATDGRVHAKIGSLSIDSGSERLKADEWYHVEFVYNTLDVRLFFNDVEVAGRTGATSWESRQPFVIGNAGGGFPGVVDEMRVSLILPRDAYVLPSETEFEFPQGTALRDRRWFIVWFDGRGRLDARRHPASVSVSLKSPADTKTVLVSPQGAVVR